MKIFKTTLLVLTLALIGTSFGSFVQAATAEELAALQETVETAQQTKDSANKAAIVAQDKYKALLEKQKLMTEYTSYTGALETKAAQRDRVCDDLRRPRQIIGSGSSAA